MLRGYEEAEAIADRIAGRADSAVTEAYIAPDGTVRPWRYSDGERPSEACCYDCGRPYSSAGDCVIPNDIWARINPTHHTGAGILCACCILDRLHHLGISGVSATLW